MTQPTDSTVPAAILGSGNIRTDLMIKIVRGVKRVRLAAMAGIGSTSDGLARAARLGVDTTASGIDALVGMSQFDGIGLVFDATSATAHRRHEALLRSHAPTVQLIDLTPAAMGLTACLW